MLTPLLALMLLAQPSPRGSDALVRAVFIHVRDATTSFDTEATSSGAPSFDAHYDSVFIACGTPPGITPVAPAPCSVPTDLVRNGQGHRALLPMSGRRADHRRPPVHAFEFHIQRIDLRGSTADVSVHFRYSTYICTGRYHMVLRQGSWRVASAEVATIS